jgi:hypothetical protein
MAPYSSAAPFAEVDPVHLADPVAGAELGTGPGLAGLLAALDEDEGPRHAPGGRSGTQLEGHQIDLRSRTQLGRMWMSSRPSASYCAHASASGCGQPVQSSSRQVGQMGSPSAPGSCLRASSVIRCRARRRSRAGSSGGRRDRLVHHHVPPPISSSWSADDSPAACSCRQQSPHPWRARQIPQGLEQRAVLVAFDAGPLGVVRWRGRPRRWGRTRPKLSSGGASTCSATSGTGCGAGAGAALPRVPPPVPAPGQQAEQEPPRHALHRSAPRAAAAARSTAHSCWMSQSGLEQHRELAGRLADVGPQQSDAIRECAVKELIESWRSAAAVWPLVRGAHAAAPRASCSQPLHGGALAGVRSCARRCTAASRAPA